MPRPKNKPAVSVFERRLQNPFGEPSSPVTFKEPNRIARWFNGAIITDKIWRAKHKGWFNVTPADLVDPDQVGGYGLDPAGNIVRGERGQEVLMWMPKDEFEQIQLAKTRVNLETMRDFDKQKRQMLNEAASRFGSQAADYLNARVGPVGTVTDTREIVERLPENE